MRWRAGLWVLLVAWALGVALAQPAWETADLWTACLLGAWLAAALRAIDRAPAAPRRAVDRLLAGFAGLTLLTAAWLRVEPAYESQRLIAAGEHFWRNGAYVDVYHAADLPAGADLPRAARPPGYPVLIGGLTAAGLPPWAAAVLLNLAFLGLVAWAVRWRQGGEIPLPPHLLALLAVALVPWALCAFAELVGACLATCALLLLPTRAGPTPGARSWAPAAAGLLFGLAGLCRPFYVPLALLPAAALAVGRAPRAAAALLAGLALVVAPWLGRNARVLGEFPVLTTHGAVTFAVCNSAASPVQQGLYDKHLFAELMRELPDEAERYHACFRRGWANLLGRPLALVRSLPVRTRGLYQETVSIAADLAGAGTHAVPYPAVFLPFSVLAYAAFWGLAGELVRRRRGLRARLLEPGYLPWREASLVVGHGLLMFGWCWGRLSLILAPYLLSLLVDPPTGYDERASTSTSDPSAS